MALNANFAAMISQAGVPDIFRDWFIAEKVFDGETFASLSAIEGIVDDNINAAFEQEGRVFPSLGRKATVVILWRLCRASMATAIAKPGEGESDAPLDANIATDLKGKYQKMHQLVLPDSMLLIPTQQNRIYWDMHKVQPVLTPMLMESIRTMASADRPVAQMLKYTPGKPLIGAEVIVVSVDGYGEIFERAEAWFFTIAFCSASNPLFFDTQTALMASKKIWALLGMTFGGGQKPPVEFYVGAWAQTVHHFSEQMRVTSCQQLIPIVLAYAAWERFWTNFVPSSSSGGAVASGTARVDSSTKLQDEVARLKNRASELQSQRDRAESRASRGADVLAPAPRGGKPGGGRNPKGAGKNANKGRGNGGNNGGGGGGNQGGNPGGRPNPGNAGYKRREPEERDGNGGNNNGGGGRAPLRRR